MAVPINIICNKCKVTKDVWVERDSKGYPSLQGLVCGDCGAVNCLSRNWENNITHTIIPPLEDGQINRFEYSYTNENGKKISKKLDPRDVNKHFNNHSKGK